MKAIKKTRQNRYKPAPRTPKAAPFRLGRDTGIRLVLMMVAVIIFSTGAVYIHDFVMQSDFFDIQKIEISGNRMTSRVELLELTNIRPEDNLFTINLFKIKKQLLSQPWVCAVSLKRNLPGTLLISVTEEEALAIIVLEGHEKIMINKQGHLFKEYAPDEDQHLNLPMVNGLHLEEQKAVYGFDEQIFNFVMEILTTPVGLDIHTIFADINTGISIEIPDPFNGDEKTSEEPIRLKLGFGNYPEKIMRAKKISRYMQQHFSQKKICSMDLFDMENIFVKTIEEENALHNNLKKGV